MGRLWQRQPHLLLALAVLLLALLEWGWLGVFQPWEGRFGDQLLQQHVQQRQPDGQVVLIDIDEASLEQLATIHGRYPWPRSVHAELLEHLLAQAPRAVLFDILFIDADPIRPDDDAWLADITAGAEQVFMPYVILQADHPEYRNLEPGALPGAAALVDGRAFVSTDSWGTDVPRIVIGAPGDAAGAATAAR